MAEKLSPCYGTDILFITLIITPSSEIQTKTGKGRRVEPDAFVEIETKEDYLFPT